MSRLMSVLVLVAAACGGDDGGQPHLPDAAASLDAATSDGAIPADAPGPPSLIVEWTDAPPLPGMVSSTVQVETASFFVKRLEVLGDNGMPTFTTERDYQLAWGPALPPPPSIVFSSALPAIYSTVRIELDQNLPTPTLEITGIVMIAGVGMRDFRIVSEDRVLFEIDEYNVTFDFSGTEIVPVHVDLGVALAGVDWAGLPEQGTTRVLDDNNDAAMAAFLATLDDAFINPGF